MKCTISREFGRLNSTYRQILLNFASYGKYYWHFPEVQVCQSILLLELRENTRINCYSYSNISILSIIKLICFCIHWKYSRTSWFSKYDGTTCQMSLLYCNVPLVSYIYTPFKLESWKLLFPGVLISLPVASFPVYYCLLCCSSHFRPGIPFFAIPNSKMSPCAKTISKQIPKWLLINHPFKLNFLQISKIVPLRSSLPSLSHWKPIFPLLP